MDAVPEGATDTGGSDRRVDILTDTAEEDSESAVDASADASMPEVIDVLEDDGTEVSSVDVTESGALDAETDVDVVTESPATDVAETAELDSETGGDVGADIPPSDVTDTAMLDTEPDSDGAAPDAIANDGGSVPLLPGESSYPWVTDHCKVWTSSPYGGNFAATNSEGVWLLDEFGGTASRGTPSGWYLSRTFAPNLISNFVGAAGWLCAVEYGGRLHYHVAGGGWSTLTGVPFSTTPGAVWGDGNDLFVVASDTETVFEFDGSVWMALHRTTVTASGTVLADGTDGELFLYNVNGLHHYASGAWSDITLPTTTTLTALVYDGTGRVFVAAGPSMFSWDGSAWRAIASPCSTALPPALTRLTSGIYTTCSASALERWSSSTDTWVGVAPGMPGTPIQDPSGGVDIFSGQIERLVSGRWVVWQDYPTPTAQQPDNHGSITSIDGANFFIAGSMGVAQLVGDAWINLPGSAGADYTRFVWEATDGTLFAVQTDLSNRASLVHGQGSTWSTDLSVTYSLWGGNSITLTSVIGRNATDAFVGLEDSVYHWDGAVWSNAYFSPPAGAGGNIGSLGIGTAPWVFPTVAPTLGSQTSFQWDGGSTYDLPGPVIGNGTDATHPQVYGESGGQVVANDGTGWVSVGTPAPPTGSKITGPDLAHLAAVVDASTVEHYNGGPAWTTVNDWGIGLIHAIDIGWTDGRHVALATNIGVAICDLGP